MEHLLTADAIASLLTLTLLEIVLGIDNIIFLSIISSRLPKHQQALARRIGLMLALGGRIVFLASISWIMRLTEPVGTLAGMEISWRDVILFAGGMFLIYKATGEIRASIVGMEESIEHKKPTTFTSSLIQIALLDIVFALDSMITAVGLSDHLSIMIIANVIAIIVMLVAAEPVSAFIEKHPTLKMLALCFLLVVGMALVADGTHFHIPRNYIYAALAFSCLTETLNILTHHKQTKRKKKAK